MKIQTLFRSLKIISCLSVIFVGQAMAGIFNPQTFTLSNGLQVVLIQNHMVPVVSLSVCYKIGTADDPVGKTGISHFLEHLMFKGTKTVSGDEFKKSVLRNGGVFNAFTGADYTVYESSISTQYLDLILKLEADRMQNLNFSKEDVISELKVVWEERLMRLDNNPLGQAYEALLRSLYWHHMYGIPAIGYPYHIKGYTYEDALSHYRTWYAPNNAFLVISGDVNLDTLKPLVEKYFNAIPSREIPVKNRTPEPSHAGITTHLEQESARHSLVSVYSYFEAPNYRMGKTENFYPLIALSKILGGNETARLYRILVEEQKIAVGVSCSYDSSSFDPEPFSIEITLAPNIKLETAKKALESLLKDIATKGITAEELENCKRYIGATLAFARDGNDTSVAAFYNLAVGFTIEDIETWPDKIKALTVDQVNQAAKDVFGNKPIVTLTTYPQGYRQQQEQVDPKSDKTWWQKLQNKIGL